MYQTHYYHPHSADTSNNFFNNSAYSGYGVPQVYAPQIQNPYPAFYSGAFPNVPSQYAPNIPVPTSNMLAAIPLPSSCPMCTGNTIANLRQSTVQVPVHINMNSGMSSAGPSAMEHATLRNHLENELLAESRYPQYQYLPPTEQRPLAMKRKAEEDRQRIYVPGPNKRFQQRRNAKLQLLSISKIKQQRVQKGLKRLNNNMNRRSWKAAKLSSLDERETVRQSRLEMLQARGIKAPPKTECTLWNCPRKQFKNKRAFIPFGSPARSASRLSNLSKKSRSPIQLRRSP